MTDFSWLGKKSSLRSPPEQADRLGGQVIFVSEGVDSKARASSIGVAGVGGVVD